MKDVALFSHYLLDRYERLMRMNQVETAIEGIQYHKYLQLVCATKSVMQTST